MQDCTCKGNSNQAIETKRYTTIFPSGIEILNGNQVSVPHVKNNGSYLFPCPSVWRQRQGKGQSEAVKTPSEQEVVVEGCVLETDEN